jgi:DNA-binding transcriptional MocR family regulator
MSVWVELPAPFDAAALLVKSQDRGVIFAPARYFYFQETRHNAFRLCFAHVTDEQIEKGIGILGELLRAEARKGKAGRRTSAVDAGVALV